MNKSPTFIAARHRATRLERRWQRKQQGGLHRAPRFCRIANFRIHELERLYLHRWGAILPKDDAGRDDLAILLHHLAFTRGDVIEKMVGAAAKWAPWLSTADAEQLVKQIRKRPIFWSAPALADRLRLTDAERTDLNITTIRPFDVPMTVLIQRGKQRRVERQRERRRQSGVVPRVDWESRSKTRLKPWAAQGISRATWYRRKGETGVKPTNVEDILHDTDLSQRKSQGSTGTKKQAKRAWEAASAASGDESAQRKAVAPERHGGRSKPQTAKPSPSPERSEGASEARGSAGARSARRKCSHGTASASPKRTVGAGDDVFRPNTDPRSGHIAPCFKLVHQDERGRWHLELMEPVGSA